MNAIVQAQHERFALQLPYDVGHRVVLDDLAFVDDRDVAAELLGLIQIVRRQYDRHAGIVDLAHESPHGAADFYVDTGRRLVEYQQARLVHEGSGDHEPPLHTARQPARDFVSLVPQMQQPQVLLGAPPRHAARYAVVTCLIDERVEAALEHVEVDFLRHDADAGLGRLPRPVEIVTEHRDLAARLVDERSDDAYRRRLAGAVRPQQRTEVAFGNREIDRLQRRDAVAVNLAKAFEYERIHRVGRDGPPGGREQAAIVLGCVRLARCAKAGLRRVPIVRQIRLHADEQQMAPVLATRFC